MARRPPAPNRKPPAAKTQTSASSAETQLFQQAIGLHQRGQLAPAKAIYEQILAKNPQHFDALHLLGVIAYETAHPEIAVDLIGKAIQINPNVAATYSNRGNALKDLKRFEDAIASYDKALALKPDYADAFFNQAIVFEELKRFEDAIASYDKAIVLIPDYADAFYNRGNALKDLKRFEDAIASYDKAIALKPDYAQAYWNKSLLLLLMGDFAPGWQLYEWRLQKDDLKDNYYTFPDKLAWRGQSDLRGKTLLIYAEQGLGDVIQFCRYIPMLQSLGAALVVEVPKPLVSLISTLPCDMTLVAKGDLLPHFDAYCPVMSLPLVFNTTVETIPAKTPYLFSDHNKVQAWRHRLGKQEHLRVGLVWSGSADHANDRNRSIDLQTMCRLLDLPVQWHSLQKEYRQDTLAVLEQHPEIHQHQEDLHDFSDTTALIECLDLVIAVDTSVAHVAGALGKPVWILLPYMPDYRWLLDRDDSPWYPTARLFRQPAIGDWGNVIKRIELEIQQTFQSVRENGKSMNDEVSRRKSTIANNNTDIERWSNPKNLENGWKRRSEIAAKWIAVGSNVLDIGCGAMELEKYLPFGCNYIPCDVVKRDERTTIFDANKTKLPSPLVEKSDIIVLLGVLEYIFDIENFLKNLSSSSKIILCSYCAKNLAPDLDRKSLGWVNDLSMDDLQKMCTKHNLTIENLEQIDDVQYLMKITSKPKINTKSIHPKVHVVSYNNVGNFGDRLGYHLINNILPPEAIVSWSTLDRFCEIPKNLDLLIIGIGNSLFGDLLNSQLISAAKSAKHCIGIFGTQYRDSLPTERLHELLDSLTWWFARYEEDLLLYGRSRRNTSHLGDWLINAFPMAQGNDEKILTIGKEIWNDLPLDRTIQNIQNHKFVVSTRLHPLLCALTSAQYVSYSEQYEGKNKSSPSGKFRSMLIDIFGRDYPEFDPWEVDKNKVFIYKRKVYENTKLLKSKIWGLLNSE